MLKYSILSLSLFTSFSYSKLVPLIPYGTNTTEPTGNSTGLPVIERELTRYKVPGIRSADFGIDSMESMNEVKMTENQYFDTILTNNNNYWYGVEVEIGTNGEKVMLEVDTASSDMWVQSEHNPKCNQKCKNLGTYDSSTSRSHRKINENFETQAWDNNKGTGDWVSDVVTINTNAVEDFTFGVVKSNTKNTGSGGVLGVGFQESGGAGLGLQSYTNYPNALAKAGIINSASYSLYLSADNKNGGYILFGGVDHSKYVGDLVSANSRDMEKFTVRLTGLKVGGTTFEYSMELDVLLNSNLQRTYIPANMLHLIASDLGGLYQKQLDAYIIYGIEKCNPTGDVEFRFDCLTIKVPLKDFLDPMVQKKYTDQPPVPAGCAITLLPSRGEYPVLGTSFLKHAYVIFDSQNHQVSIAQANLNAMGQSDIEAIRNDGPYYLNVPKAIACNSSVIFCFKSG